MSRLDLLTRLFDISEDETLPADVRQACGEAAHELFKTTFRPAKTFPPNLAAYLEGISA